MDTNLYEQRTRVQNQQTNTFLKGMDTDTSDMLLGSDQYRYAENIRIITNEDNNSGEVRLIEGNVNIPIYLNDEPLKDIGRIMAFDAIRDIVVLITEKDDTWSVYKINIKDLRKYLVERNVYANPATKFLRIDLDKYVDGDELYYDGHQVVEPSMNNYVDRRNDVFYDEAYQGDDDIKGEAELIFGPCTEPIWPDDWNGTDKVLTTVLRWEADKNIKLYIADATGKHPIMVLNIANKYNTGDFDQVFAYQRTLLPPANVEIGSGSGSIISGKVQYVYRLYSKTGAATPLSIISKTLSLYKNEYSGYEAEKRSGRSVNISINVSNRGNLDYVQIYRISYQLSGQLPKISLVKDEKIISSFIDTGTDVVENIGMSELLSMFTPFIYPKQIESKGDYLFAGNMKYSQDAVDADFSQFDTRSYNIGSVTEYETPSGQEAYIRVLNIDNNGYVNSIRDIDSDDIPMHLAFIEPPYEYNANHWKTIKYIDDGQTKECNGYGKNISWRYIYQDLPELSPQNQTGINETINNKSTFRCGEVYRFGVKLYNQYGQASSVKWIADIMIPDKANMYDDNGTIKFRNVGIEFFKTPESNWDGISGWEIVRCERTLNDRKAITQGIIGLPYKCYTYTTDNTPHTKQEFLSTAQSATDTHLMCNPGFFSTDFSSLYHLTDDDNNSHIICIPSDNALMFSSPEICYQGDDIDSILKTNKSNIHIQTLYTTHPDTVTQQYTNISNENPGKRIFLNQSENSSMSFCFFWPYDHYSFIRNRDFEFILNYNDKYSEARGVEKTYDDGSRTRYYFNYFTPNYGKLNRFIPSNIKINDTAIIDSPDYSDFAKDTLLTYKNNTVSLQDDQFINWSVPLLLNISGQSESRLKNLIDNIDPSAIYTIQGDVNPYYIGKRACYPIGSGGKLVLLSVDNFNATDGQLDNVPSITVANIYKDTIPYGGYNKTAIDNSSYISFGDYCHKTDNSIQVYSGDTKNSIFTYNALHIWHDTTYKNCVKMATVYAVPVETDIDIQAQYGLLYGVGEFYNYNIQDKASAFDNYTQTKDAYLYNPVYNAMPDIVNWTTQEALDGKVDQFDTRIHYSNVKTNNEDVDSWTQFQSANYIDVDTRYGEITDLKLFKDKLIFWQENATGVLAVNERVVLNDQNDTQVVLGTGGVLERYDYFSTVYGQKKYQHTVATSNNSLYWWDSNNKEILLYQQKYDVTPLSTVKSVKNYINGGEESDVPFMIYDNKYKELVSNVVNNEAIVYNEQVQAFTSIYKFAPMFGGTVNGGTILTSLNKLYAHNVQYNNEAMLFGEDIHPMVSYVVNALPTYNKTYDVQTIGGRFYGGGFDDDLHERNKKDLKPLEFTYNTPLKQKAQVGGDRVENVEYDYRLTIPRNGETLTFDPSKQYGNRLRGKFIKCQIKSNSNNLDFALQYITTKFRMSWT